MSDAGAAPPVPRPAAPERRAAELADRLRVLRGDPRVGALLLAVLAVGAGVFWFRSGTASSGPTGGTTSGAAATPSVPVPSAPPTTPALTEVMVHVAGAVTRPGVVTLPASARVVDALDAAGGPAADADLDRLNLAAKLADGERIAVARLGQPPPPLDSTTGPGNSGGSGQPSGPVNLNTASQAELEALPGIGPSLAGAIIAERDRRGGFTSVDDLKRVRGIGDQRFAQLRDLVTV